MILGYNVMKAPDKIDHKLMDIQHGIVDEAISRSGYDLVSNRHLRYIGPGNTQRINISIGGNFSSIMDVIFKKDHKVEINSDVTLFSIGRTCDMYCDDICKILLESIEATFLTMKPYEALRACSNYTRELNECRRIVIPYNVDRTLLALRNRYEKLGNNNAES